MRLPIVDAKKECTFATINKWSHILRILTLMSPRNKLLGGALRMRLEDTFLFFDE